MVASSIAHQGFVQGLLLVLITGLLGCDGRDTQDQPVDQEGDPVQLASRTAEDLLSLARAGDWGTYVDRYYGESHKFRSAADRDQLVQRFENQWGQKVVESLERVVKVTPVIEADQAIFREAGEVLFVLYRGADGEWKFHL